MDRFGSISYFDDFQKLEIMDLYYICILKKNDPILKLSKNRNVNGLNRIHYTEALC
jgi:hypothetical protein